PFRPTSRGEGLMEDLVAVFTGLGAGAVIDRMNKFSSSRFGMIRYNPADSSRNIISPARFGTDGRKAARDGLGSFASSVRSVKTCSSKDGLRLLSHLFPASICKRAAMEASGFNANSMPVTSLPLTTTLRGEEAAESPSGELREAISSYCPSGTP